MGDDGPEKFDGSCWDKQRDFFGKDCNSGKSNYNEPVAAVFGISLGIRTELTLSADGSVRVGSPDGSGIPATKQKREQIIKIFSETE